MSHDIKCPHCGESVLDVKGDVLVLRSVVEHQAFGHHKLMLKLCDKQGNVVQQEVDRHKLMLKLCDKQGNDVVVVWADKL